MRIYNENLSDIRECLLPAQYPEQIIFERRDDGLYNMTVKVYAIDSDDKSRTKIAYEKCTCPPNEEVYQCTMYMYYHPDEVAEFEKYVREGVTRNERKAESKETEKGNKIS